MKKIMINDKISYIKASENPLSADVGIINVCGATWLYDVGNNEDIPKSLGAEYNIVLSHFHADHIGNIDKIRAKNIYLSGTTYAHVHRGIVVDSDIFTFFHCRQAMPRDASVLKWTEYMLLSETRSTARQRTAVTLTTLSF